MSSGTPYRQNQRGKSTIPGGSVGETSNSFGNEPPNNASRINLPLEIVRMILEEAIPRDVLLPSRWHRSQGWTGRHKEQPTFFDKPFLRTKRNVVVVSKLWYGAGIDLVYEQVMLYRAEQVLQFLSSISNPERALGTLVRGLVILGWPSDPPLENTGGRLSIERIQTILGLCPNLSKFEFLPDESMDMADLFHPYMDGYLPPHSLCRQPGIQSLSISLYTLLHWRFNTFLNILATLESFTLDLRTTSTQLQRVVDWDRITSDWPALKSFQCFSLSIACTHSVFYGERALPRFMPSLERLSVYTEGVSFRLFRDVFSSLSTPSLLKYFALVVHSLPYTLEARFFQQFLNACPSLEHLVVDCNVPPEYLASASHPGLRWIDIWMDTRRGEFVAKREEWNVEGCLEATVNAAFARFDKLESFRFFDKGLLETEPFIDLPAVLSPEKHGSSRDCDDFEVAYRLLGARVVQRGRFFCRKEK